MKQPVVRAEGGFTLLEILAAFVVFALVFATTLQVLSGALRNTQRSADYTVAALHAQSVMEALGIEPPLEEGTFRGDFDDGYRWEMDVVPVEIDDLWSPPAAEGEAGEAPAQPGPGGDLQDIWEIPIDLFEVELRVYWGEPVDERMVRFHTLRSVTPEP